MKDKRQEVAPPDKYDGDVMVEVDEESGRSSTLRRYSWKRQNPKNMDLSRWGAEAGVLEQEGSALSKEHDIPGTAEGAGRVRVMREGDGGEIAGIPPDDTSQTGKGRAVELGSLGHRRRPANISPGLPDQGRAYELPCGGLPRKGWETDSDADAFLQPACPGNHDNLGGGKPPTPKVITMRLAGTVAGTQW